MLCRCWTTPEWYALR